jgi:methionyl-tRNA formyltransferase
VALAPQPAGRPARLAFLGTPAMSVPPLRALVDAGFEVALVVTRADAKRGRGSALVPSPVKQAALDLGIPVTDRPADVVDAGIDLGVVVAYGRIIRPEVLERVPMVNLHFSLLPRWRGAAPVERAVLAGDRQTGVDLMVVEEGLDTGAIHGRAVLDVGPDETAEELRQRLVAAGTDLLVRSLEAGLGDPTPQVGDAVYAEKIDPAELELRWEAPAEELHRVVRVGGAWTTFRSRRLKVWRSSVLDPVPDLAAGEVGRAAGGAVPVGTGDGTLGLTEVQPEGKARMDAVAWANGAQPAGQRLGT